MKKPLSIKEMLMKKIIIYCHLYSYKIGGLIIPIRKLTKQENLPEKLIETLISNLNENNKSLDSLKNKLGIKKINSESLTFLNTPVTLQLEQDLFNQYTKEFFNSFKNDIFDLTIFNTQDVIDFYKSIEVNLNINLFNVIFDEEICNYSLIGIIKECIKYTYTKNCNYSGVNEHYKIPNKEYIAKCARNLKRYFLENYNIYLNELEMSNLENTEMYANLKELLKTNKLYNLYSEKEHTKKENNILLDSKKVDTGIFINKVEDLNKSIEQILNDPNSTWNKHKEISSKFDEKIFLTTILANKGDELESIAIQDKFWFVKPEHTKLKNEIENLTNQIKELDLKLKNYDKDSHDHQSIIVNEELQALTDLSNLVKMFIPNTDCYVYSSDDFETSNIMYFVEKNLNNSKYQNLYLEFKELEKIVEDSIVSEPLPEPQKQELIQEDLELDKDTTIRSLISDIKSLSNKILNNQEKVLIDTLNLKVDKLNELYDLSYTIYPSKVTNKHVTVTIPKFLLEKIYFEQFKAITILESNRILNELKLSNVFLNDLKGYVYYFLLNSFIKKISGSLPKNLNLETFITKHKYSFELIQKMTELLFELENFMNNKEVFMKDFINFINKATMSNIKIDPSIRTIKELNSLVEQYSTV